MKCLLCMRLEPEAGFIGHVAACAQCYNKWEAAERNERLVVAMDKDIESDERVKSLRSALEACQNALKSAQERLNQYEYPG